jgi:hypothetical protein
MIPLTWRQHRLQALISAAVLAALAGYLLLTGRQISSFLHTTGLSACLQTHGNCSGLANAFTAQHPGAPFEFDMLIWLMPILIGLFWGAPLIAREAEQGTHRLAWTQSVSRSRWLGVKLGAIIPIVLLAAGVFAVLFSWWFGPFAQVCGAGYCSQSRMTPNMFDFSGVMPVAYTLYAFALGTAAGAIVRRTIPAMAVTVAGFIALRFPLQSLRYHLLAPLTVSYPAFGNTPAAEKGGALMSYVYTTAAGRLIPANAITAACPRQTTACALAHGFRELDTYQPASRFWPLQGTESGIFLGAALALLAVGVWYAARRTA